MAIILLVIYLLALFVLYLGFVMIFEFRQCRREGRRQRRAVPMRQGFLAIFADGHPMLTGGQDRPRHTPSSGRHRFHTSNRFDNREGRIGFDRWRAVAGATLDRLMRVGLAQIVAHGRHRQR